MCLILLLLSFLIIFSSNQKTVACRFYWKYGEIVSHVVRYHFRRNLLHFSRTKVYQLSLVLCERI